MEKINIAELLKDCPQGMKLYTTVWGGVEFIKLLFDVGLIKVSPTSNLYNTSSTKLLYSDGSYAQDGECVLFPSKENRDWSKFHKPFKDGDIICTKIKNGNKWLSIYKELEGRNLRTYASIVLDNLSFYCKGILCRKEEISEQRLATEEEKEILFQAIKDNGYHWNDETKTLEELPKFKVGDKVKHIDDKTVITITGIKDGYYFIQFYNTRRKDYQNEKVSFKDQDEYELVPNKFDITKLKPFKSEVLIRNDKTQKWIPAFWGYKADNRNYVTTYGTCRYCIPYEGNEHLLTTNNDCSDYYKTWEE